MEKRLILLLVLFFSFLFLFGLAFSRYAEKNEQQFLIATLPSILITSLEGYSINLNKLGRDIPKVLIYFNSTCPICQSEAELIRKVFSGDQNTSFIWISSESVEEVKDFRERYDFESLSNHTFFSDTLFRLASEFKLTSVPATLVYDSKGELVEFFKGAVSMTDLKEAVNKAHESSR